MIERVAAAIQKYWLENEFDPSEANDGVARAAIAAMREPSEKMLRADLAASKALKSPHTLRQQQIACWHASIDAVLSTPQTQGARE